MSKKTPNALVPSTGTPLVYRSFDEIRIRSNARNIPVHICKLRDKMKSVDVKLGSVVAQALDQAQVAVDETDVSNLDIRVNGRPAELLQVLGENDTIYIASKVSGN